MANWLSTWLLGLDADGDCRWRVVVAFAFVFVVVFVLLRRPYSRLKRKPEVTYSKEAARTTRPAIAIASHSPVYSPLTKLCGKVSKTRTASIKRLMSSTI